MRIVRIVPRLALTLAALCPAVHAQQVDVGGGAPNEAIRLRFVSAYFRGNFAQLVSLPPLGEVRSFGSAGYVQEFPDSAKTPGVRFALIKANQIGAGEDAIDTFQVHAKIYAAYSAVGQTTAGYPTSDTEICAAPAGNVCRMQSFDLKHVLFVWDQSPSELSGGTSFTLRDPFFSRWVQLGGASIAGAAITGEINVASLIGTAATAQFYANGAIYNITSGLLTGRLIGVRQPIYAAFANAGGQSGSLGMPTTEELNIAGGKRRQSFEGGSIEYTFGSSDPPVLRSAVGTVGLSAGPSIRLNAGDTLAIEARLTDLGGGVVADRDIAWTTSNARVVVIQGTGARVTLRAVGGGSANIVASSEGRSSSPLTVFVSAPCCQIGEGAPSAAVQQAFQDAATRNRLSLRLPAAGPVRRIGGGYTQEFLTLDSGARVMIAKPDASALAWVLGGGILAAYEAMGGPGGMLGYPTSDGSAGGRQTFENSAALAGDPVRLVAGVILSRWATLGYETGVLGPPTSDAAPFLTFTATAGRMQGFRDGTILAGETGAQAGRAYFVRGLIAARYVALGGAAGRFGMPVTEEFQSGGRRRQDFEGGSIEYAPGDAEAQATERQRRPTVSATPVAVVAGNCVRLAVGGFESGATLRVSISGQADFVVNAPSGAYTWEAYIPPAARSSIVVVRAVDMARTTVSAEASYNVRAISDSQLELVKLRGDTQTGAPGATLPQALRIAVRDESDNPVAGVPVRFNASPGAQITPVSATTNEQGEAEATLRLPAGEGVALATAEAARGVVTFSARVAASTLSNFPRFTQAVDGTLGNGTAPIARKGALLTAVAAVLRYHQNRGDMPAPNGSAEPALLNQFLRNSCVFDAGGAQICDAFLTPQDTQEQVINLWRLGAFVSGALEVSVERTELSAIRDLIAAGSPVVLALALSANDAPAGAHFVVGIGIAGDGGVQILDPNPALGRASLSEYLAGFSDGTSTWKGVVSGAFRLLPRTPGLSGFLLSGNAAVSIASAAGVCGATLEWPGRAAIDDPPQPQAAAFRMRHCDGSQPAYQLDLSGASGFRSTFTDLGGTVQRSELSGAAAATFKVIRPGTQWLVTSQDVSFAASSVVSAASFLPRIAPGGLLAIFGSGLARSGTTTRVEINGVNAPVLFAAPFQLNVQAPAELAAGTHPLRVRSVYGETEQAIELREVAPAIFTLSGQRGAVVNQDGTINSTTSPGRRGQAIVIYGTGLGAVARQGNLNITQRQVVAVLAGRQIPAFFAGLTPGFIGLYQVNVMLPVDTPPGLSLALTLRQAEIDSNPVEIAVQ